MTYFTQMAIYGTVLRVWEFKHPDGHLEYTIIPPIWATRYRKEGSRTLFACVRGFASGVAADEVRVDYAASGTHLGRRTRWKVVPAHIQKVCREQFPDYTPAA